MRLNPLLPLLSQIPIMEVFRMWEVLRQPNQQGGPGGKFKFKDSIRERFSHEFEAKSENATVTSDHFTGSHAANASKVSSSHQEFYAKRRRPSRSCDESGSEVNSSTS